MTADADKRDINITKRGALQSTKYGVINSNLLL